jgi:predicted lipoprotein with Yx(FWY)xxD motif
MIRKNWFLVVVLIIIVLVVGYLGRHRIKAMLGMYPSPAPVAQTSTSSPSAAMAPSDNIYTTKTDPTKGSYLADFSGMTLYTYDKDTAGVSNCYGTCATVWPPYTSGATAESALPANITVVTRTDGTKQFAWNGMPLYYYAKDKNPGDILGDGVGGIWHLVKP